MLDASSNAPDTSDACVPTPNACDGLAHNCDGVVGKGCPIAMAGFGAPTTNSPSWGGGGGTAFSDACPAGQVLIGMAGTVGGSLQSINGICGVCVVEREPIHQPR